MVGSPSIAIVNSIADKRGTDPNNLDFVLEDHIDTDAIRYLLLHDSDSWTLTFEMPDHTVTVSGCGAVRVDGVEKGVILT